LKSVNNPRTFTSNINSYRTEIQIGDKRVADTGRSKVCCKFVPVNSYKFGKSNQNIVSE
jgi:hypothetical protein